MGRTLVLWPRGGLWRHADFVKLWSAQSISQFGTQVSALAIPPAAIIVLHASAFDVASLNTAQIDGPGLGGVIVGLATAPHAILADAASFVRSAVFIGIPVQFGIGPAIAGSSLITGPPMLLIPLAPLSYPLPFLIVAIGMCFASVPIVCSPIRSLQVMPEPEELPAITVPFAAPTDA